jgi:rhamnulokinase
MAQWKALGLETDYDILLAAAEASNYNVTIDVDNDAFAASGDMAKAITDFCLANGATPPASQAEFVRCVVLSLAQRYKRGIQQLNSLLPHPVECLHIIGGGCRNKLLNRMTEEAIGIPVIAGPVEATATGNILLQAQSI